MDWTLYNYKNFPFLPWFETRILQLVAKPLYRQRKSTRCVGKICTKLYGLHRV